MTTFVICGSYLEFEQYLNRVVGIGNRENRANGYPYVYVGKTPDKIEKFGQGDEVVLYGRYTDNPVYRAHAAYRRVINHVRHVEDPGPREGLAKEMRQRNIEAVERERRGG